MGLKIYTIGIVGAYSPKSNLHLSASPGRTFKEAEVSLNRLALRMEAFYDFHLYEIHLGSSLELTYVFERFHLSFGIHFGIGK